jgi:hypothetical protein
MTDHESPPGAGRVPHHQDPNTDITIITTSRFLTSGTADFTTSDRREDNKTPAG